MGIIVNQSIKNALISYIGVVIGFVSTIFLFPNIIGAEGFGLTRSMIAIMTVSVQLVNLGVPNSIIKFFPYLSQKSDNPQGLFWVFVIPPLIGLFVFSFLFIGFEDRFLELYSDSSLLVDYFYLLIPLIFSLASFGLLNAFIKASFNTVFASFLQEVLLRLIVILDLVLFYYDLISFDHFILIFVFNYTLQYIILLFYAIKKGYLRFKVSFKPFDKLTRKNISQYSFFSFFSGFTMILVGNIDIIMVDIFEGLEKTGIYAIALYVGAVISIPRRSISKISFPVISKSFKDKDLSNIENIYKQSSLNQLLAGLLIYIGVIANIDNLYSLLPDAFAEGSIVIFIIGLANLFDIATGANGQIIISSKYYRYDFIFSGFLMLNSIILNFLLIPTYGLVGAAIATASSIFLYNLIKMVFVWVKFKMQPFRWETLGILVVGVLSFLMSEMIPQIFNTYFDIILRSLFITVFFLGSVWFFKLSAEVNKILKKVFSRLTN